MSHAAATQQPELFSLPALHKEIRRQSEELAQRFAERHREVRLHPLDHDELHPQLWDAISARGWPGLLVPAAFGGRDGGLLGWVVAIEALAAANPVLWMPVLTAATGHALAEVGPDSARQRWLERIASGDVQLALSVTEPECGHNVFRTRTTVRRDGDRFIVNGRKAVTSGIELADGVLVLGRSQTSEGGGGRPHFTTLLLEAGTPGITRRELPMRHREGVRQWELELADVEAPLDALVGVEGQGC